jgi:hypothetical protein
MKGAIMAPGKLVRVPSLVLLGVVLFSAPWLKPATAQDSRTELKGNNGKIFEGPAFGKVSGASSGGILEALRDRKAREEIGLVPEQLDELRRLTQQVSTELQPLIDDFNKLPKAEQKARADDFRQDLSAYLKSVQTDLDKILLPEQQERLRQVAFQLRIQKAGAVQTFVAPDVLRALGVDEAQAERLQQDLEQIEADYRRQVADLEVEKERKILALFTPTQQKQVKAMIGPVMRSLSAAGTPGGAVRK